MKKYRVAELNELLNDSPREAVQQAEKVYADSLKAVAEEICEQSAQKPIVFIAGTSGSSKTTTALRLAEYIEQMGHRAYALSMDDYFLNKDECQAIFDGGEIDYESPLCVDRKLLGEHMQKMARHEMIEIPQFDFVKQCRKNEGEILTCKDGDIVIIEGIHGLNPLITADYSDLAAKIYVELQACVVDEETEICSDKLRMLRRIMRDSRFRGHTVERTVAYCTKLSQGEQKFILPFVEKADWRVNTFLDYELNIYRNDILALFAPLAVDFKNEWGLDEIGRLLENLRFLPLEYAPKDSLVREFTGESSLKY